MEMVKIKNANDLHKAVQEERKAGTLTRARAVRLHCFDCSGFNSFEVAKCPHKLCPLYEFRRTKRETIGEDEE